MNLNVADEQNLYWEHPDGLHSIRIVYLADRVIGFNTMGVRFRHRVCEAWIAEGRSLEYVLDHLEEANFDPNSTDASRRARPTVQGEPGQMGLSADTLSYDFDEEGLGFGKPAGSRGH
ncbi:MAG: hypothetical protein VCF24_18170 [Candidatus Latescibacterota bacterium]